MSIADTGGAFSPVRVRRAIHSSGLSVAEVARQIRVPSSKLHAVLAGHHHLPAYWLERLPLSVLLPLLVEVAHGHGLGLALMLEGGSVLSDVRALSQVARECGEAAGAFGDAIADGVLTAAEADTVEREADEAIRALLALKLRAREARRERVSGVRL